MPHEDGALSPFELYGAPVGLFFSTDRSLAPPQWSDLGMCVQTVMLLARGEGLHSCGSEASIRWHKAVSAYLAVPDEDLPF